MIIKTDNKFKEQPRYHGQFGCKGDEPNVYQIATRVPERYKEFLESLPNKSEWLRAVITKTIDAELANNQ